MIFSTIAFLFGEATEDGFTKPNIGGAGGTVPGIGGGGGGGGGISRALTGFNVGISNGIAEEFVSCACLAPFEVRGNDTELETRSSTVSSDCKNSNMFQLVFDKFIFVIIQILDYIF